MPEPPVMPPLPVEWVRVDDLYAAERNPKLHDVPAVAASIRRHGYVDHGVLDRRTDRLIGGHGRSEALRWLREQGEHPSDWPGGPGGIHVDADGEWWAATSVTTTVDEHEAEALLVALNSGDRAGWNRDQLAELLDDLRQSNPEHGLEGTGYDNEAVNDLLEDIHGAAPALPEGDTDPALGDHTEFRVMVTCSDEAIQASLVEELEGRGYVVQLQMS